MERSLFSVFVQPVIIVKAVGYIGVFLDFCEKGSGADCMDGSWADKKDVVLFHRNTLKVLSNRSLQDAFPERVPVNTVLQSINQLGMTPGGKHIPQLCLAELPIFVETGIDIVRVNLDGKIFFCVYQLNQDRQGGGSFMMLPQQLGMTSQNRSKINPLERSAGSDTDAIRIGRTLPRLC